VIDTSGALLARRAELGYMKGLAIAHDKLAIAHPKLGVGTVGEIRADARSSSRSAMASAR